MNIPENDFLLDFFQNFLISYTIFLLKFIESIY